MAPVYAHGTGPVSFHAWLALCECVHSETPQQNLRQPPRKEDGWLQRLPFRLKKKTTSAGCLEGAKFAAAPSANTRLIPNRWIIKRTFEETLLNSRRCSRSQKAALETSGTRSPLEGLCRAIPLLLQAQLPRYLIIRCFAEQFLFRAQEYMKAASVSKAAAWPDMRRMLAANQAAAASLSADVGGIFYISVAKGPAGASRWRKRAIYWCWKLFFFTSKKNSKMKKKN